MGREPRRRPEYETTDTFGAMCGVADMNAITMANYRCNQYGLDTISAGATIAFAMECYQRGILTPEQTGGVEVRFGDANLVVDLVEKIARRQDIAIYWQRAAGGWPKSWVRVASTSQSMSKGSSCLPMTRGPLRSAA